MERRNSMSMRVSQRENGIIEYINQCESATVAELSRHFNVSEITIRRDLERLNEKRIIDRFHGGARRLELPNGDTTVTEFRQKSLSMSQEKARIGQRACQFVRDFDTVFMNSGTTVLQFLMQLQCRGVTVVTNNVAALDCPHHPGVDILMLGGTYNERTRSVGGEITTGNLLNIYSTCTILGVNALDLNEGMTTSVYHECTTNNAMISHSKGKVIVLADSSKMGKISSYVSSPLSKIDVIITDTGCPESYVAGFESNGIEVITV